MKCYIRRDTVGLVMFILYMATSSYLTFLTERVRYEIFFIAGGVLLIVDATLMFRWSDWSQSGKGTKITCWLEWVVGGSTIIFGIAELLGWITLPIRK